VVVFSCSHSYHVKADDEAEDDPHTDTNTNNNRNMDAIRLELEYVVQILAMGGSFLYLRKRDREWFLSKSKSKSNANNNKFSIPFVALDGIGKRRVVVERVGREDSTGSYRVEECLVENRTMRRLYFRHNEGVVQTEVVMKEDGHFNEETPNGIVKKKKMVVDPLDLSFDYHRHILK